MKTEPRSNILDKRLPGMQLAFFETVWDAFEWIESIWIKESKGQFQFFVQATDAQDDKEWDDFDYLAGKVVKAVERLLDKLEPGSKHEIEHVIQHGPAVPRNEGYRELMSDRLYRMLAKRHAPSRLEILERHRPLRKT